jgi:ubiquinone/menaquinone biosynthesis C-methylase UbiE
MAHDLASYVGSIPENYERYRATDFEPYADDLAGRVASAGLRGPLLELACGTGILTERLRARLPPSVRIVATDLNPPMLEYARTKRAEMSGVDWQQADAGALPFASGSFDAVLCQFGFMFVPDKAVAFREARRVLVPHGLLAFNVWDSIGTNPSMRVVQQTITSFLGHEPGFFHVPFALHDRSGLRDAVRSSGFRQIKISTVSIRTVSPSARSLATGIVMGSPASLELQQRGIASEPVIEAAAAALARAFGDRPCETDRRALVVTARAP